MRLQLLYSWIWKACGCQTAILYLTRSHSEVFANKKKKPTRDQNKVLRFQGLPQQVLFFQTYKQVHQGNYDSFSSLFSAWNGPSVETFEMSRLILTTASWRMNVRLHSNATRRLRMNKGRGWGAAGPRNRERWGLRREGDIESGIWKHISSEKRGINGRRTARTEERAAGSGGGSWPWIWGLLSVTV